MRTQWQALSIRNKVVIAASGILVIGLSILVTIISNTIYHSTEKAGLALLEREAKGQAKEIEAFFDLAYSVPRQLATTIDGFHKTQMPERKAIDQVLIKLLNEYPSASGIWMLMEPNALDGKDSQYQQDWPIHDPTGRYMPYITRSGDKIAQDTMLGAEQQKIAEPFRNNPAGYTPAYEKSGWGDFYFVPKQRGRDTVTEPYVYEVQGEKVLMSSLTVAMKDPAGKFAGLAAMDMPLGQLQKTLGQFKPFGTGALSLISETGLQVVTQDTAQLGKPVDTQLLPADVTAKLKNREMARQDHDDQFQIWIPVRIGNTGQYWTLGLNVPRATIMADAVAAKHKAILIGGLTGVGLVTLIAILLSWLLKPLNTLATAMTTLASGTGDLTHRLEVHSQDEIGRSSAAFNEFMERLRSMFIQVREQSGAVSQAAQDLSSSAASVSQASRQQAEAASATASSVEEVTVSIQHVASTTEDVNELAHSANTQIDGGKQLVGQVAGEVAAVDRSVKVLGSTIEGLTAELGNVDRIVGVIKDIADQTNLLALNAAIEAARAGEQGRGFAVVADEVRKLASKTAEATVEIGNIVTQIQNEIGSAAREMGNTNRNIRSSVSLSEEASQSIDSVFAANDGLVSRVEMIASSAREQAMAITEIAQHVERISNMASSNDQAMTEVMSSVGKLRDFSSNLQELVARFKT
ncbi:methyl-accepting chemotaxis protein [Chitinibacter tainanensis]|uniref:methyl-accepting chemotaxis protein n=1 Tax=Chitinibacter tainanensis TaxID=230667 RepID=UPI0004105C73|nr:methyl-accepting chemotaxis protein [Chitinibacter tainanensis]